MVVFKEVCVIMEKSYRMEKFDGIMDFSLWQMSMKDYLVVLDLDDALEEVWVPKIPAWEKEFCLKIGLFKWEAFVEAKKFVHLETKIINWDDSAGKKAFDNAKSRFYAQINKLPCEIPLPDPDMYIDNLDSSSHAATYEDDTSEIEESDEESNVEMNDSKYPAEVAIEDIKATGWDGWDEEKYEQGNPLTGMIVGGH
ncbi:hypothetical protein LguiB_028421 [Lonicera macranthoides]